MDIAQAIASRRSAFRLSEEEVAELAGLPASTVRSVERRTHRPSAFELARLADALAMDPASLWRGEYGADDPRRGSARFLAGPTLGGITAKDHRLLARAAEVGRIGAELWRLLGKAESTLIGRRTVSPLSSREEAWEQGYALAQADRQAIADTGRPLDSVQALLEAQGVHVALVDFDVDDVIAASLSEPGALPVILLNRRHSRVQRDLARRSVLAHEICHILHDATEQNVVSMVSRRTQEGEPWEQRANGYAPSFLAPAAWVRVDSTGPRRIVQQLATQWLLSWEGGCWHAKNLKLITPQHTKRLMGEGPRDWRAPEVNETMVRTPMEMVGLECAATPLVSGLVSELVAQAFADGEISRGRAEEVLRIR